MLMCGTWVVVFVACLAYLGESQPCLCIYCIALHIQAPGKIEQDPIDGDQVAL